MSDSRIYQNSAGNWILWDGEFKQIFQTEGAAQTALNRIQFSEVNMSEKLVVVRKVRADMRVFVDAARALQSDLEDLSLLGFMPDGDNPIGDDDLASDGLTATVFFAGVQVFAKIAPTPTAQEQSALIRMARR